MPHHYAVDHDHRELASEGHRHDRDYAEKNHRHRDDERQLARLQEALNLAEARISNLEAAFGDAQAHIRELEQQLGRLLEAAGEGE